MSTHDSNFEVDGLTLSAERMARSTIKLFRGFFAITGILAVALGVALLVWPGRSLKVAAVLLSIYIVAIAIMRLATGIVAKDVATSWRVLDLIFGLVMLVGGIFMLRNITLTAASLTMVIVFVVGFSWIVEGVIALIESGQARSQGWAIAFGILSILAGVVVLATPVWSALMLIVFTGVSLLVTGITALVRAFTFGKDVMAQL